MAGEDPVQAEMPSEKEDEKDSDGEKVASVGDGNPDVQDEEDQDADLGTASRRQNRARGGTGGHVGVLLYVVTYDVPATDNATREKLAHALKAAGLVRIQYSVFMGFLSRNEAEAVALKAQAILGSIDADVRVVPVCKHCQAKLMQVGPPVGGGKVSITRGAAAITSNYVPKGAKGLVGPGSPAGVGASVKGGTGINFVGGTGPASGDDGTIPSSPAPYLDPSWGGGPFAVAPVALPETDAGSIAAITQNPVPPADSVPITPSDGARSNPPGQAGQIDSPITTSVSPFTATLAGGPDPAIKPRDPGWKPFLLI